MKEIILEILEELRPEYNFNAQMDFIEEGMLDSFDIVNLVSSLDDAYSISISGMDIIPENFNSVEHIMALVTKNIAK
ncbi:MAG: acyl carrier protein [Bacteroidota bacterium]|nr:acyl carrier protein [Bacteroidota bacterium]